MQMSFAYMRISFVIPAYNEEQRLPLCLSALKREIDSFSYDVEVVVVNNASTDSTGRVARKYSWVRVIDEPRKGLVRARQSGYEVTSGEIIAHIDADTLVPEGWLGTVMREFADDKHLAALSGPYIYYDLSTIHRAFIHAFYITGYLSHIINHHILHTGAMIQGGNFIVRRNYFDKAGGFDTTITFYGEDTDVARRISRVGKIKWMFKLPMYTSGRRLISEGVIRSGARYAANYIYMLVCGKPFTKKYTDVRNN